MIRIKALCFWAVIVFCSIGGASGQRLVFNKLNAEHGLSQNSVLAIVQDHRGYMWLGTSYGLNRFDGKNFKIYKNDPAMPGSLSGNYILSALSDSKHTLWFGTSYGLNRYVPETDSFVSVLAGNPDEAGTLGSNTINCLFEDSRGIVWVGTNRGLHQLIDREHHRFKRYVANTQPGLSGDDIRSVYEDSQHRLWIATATGLTQMDFQGKSIRFKAFKSDPGKPGALSDDFVTTVAEDKQQHIWVGTKHGGLNLLDETIGKFIHYKKSVGSNALVHNNIRKILADRSGNLWIGTLEGLSILDPIKRTFTTYQHEPENPTGLSQNSLYDIFQDANGSVWLGTFYNGANIVYSYETPFRVYQTGKAKYSINHNVVSAVVKDKAGNLWVGTEGGGFNYLDVRSGAVRNFRSDGNAAPGMTSNLVKAIVQDKTGHLWIGTHLGGLNYYDTGRRKFTAFRNDPGDTGTLSSDNVSAVFEDSRGRLWVGTDQKGVDLLDRATKNFRHFNVGTPAPLKLSGNFVRNFYEDSRHNLWIGTNEGVNVLRSDSSSIDWIRPRDESATKRFPRVINCVREDARGLIWIGSYYGGLTRYDRATNTFTNFTQKDGLPNDNVLGILDDERGNLWISTSNGLSRFDIARRIFKNYTVADGLSGNEFISNTYYKDASGEMFFGGLNGLVSFFPNAIETNEFVAPVVFTALKLFNKPVGVGGDDGLLEKDISLTREITFTHDQNILSIDFALLNYIKPEKNKYAYRLEGFEQDWNFVKTSSATYTNLPPGTYTFEVKGANNDGVWSKVPSRLTIRVLPPLWKTWWAYGLYIVAIISAILFVTRYFYMSALFRREHELHQVKLNFFTNVSHEIRTHLTLIQGPVEQMVITRPEDEEVQTHLSLVRKNADRLLKLVSELMDFRKAETNHLALHVSQNNLVPFIQSIFQDFSFLSQHRHIESVFECSTDAIAVFFDPAQMEKVIFNLLSNAYKFTHDGGKVSLKITEVGDTVSIRIEDDGIGIAPEYLSKLFANFFQIYDHGKQNTGYGIGLALSKSIVELHKGSLKVESSVEQHNRKGRTCFTITLLKGNAHFASEQLVKVAPAQVHGEMLLAETDLVRSYQPLSAEGTPAVLIVEDHEEVRSLVMASLAGEYRIIQAVNGEEGWAQAIEHIPDLIISDVMMGEMDGLELCTRLKTDQRTSHIPVILLTARASLNHQLSGLQTGADAYIPKPFSIRFLSLNVRNLLASRALMREKYSRQVTLQPQNVVIDSMDEQFLARIVTITEELMDNPEFGVAMLAEKIGMSQSVLYKKLKAVTDLSVNDFLKSIRLKRAAQLLQQQKMTIYEVAYAVGYDDRKYFSKEFKKQFGKTPSEFAVAYGAT
ncbi:ATP-binding protein [Dyadobacter sp. CY261]|uniref:hybrid sensor histidine kinase/response regulator transcription factor n=1 Tax=Dyadobacter sp. CY261 TaxID=2907203 RepID=UPI001F15E736|nr:hybrid sensor histidine kinase/response regulator transcription factor [Dyadobacter sp. CY261]MCF0072983.1 ATP-binding protein [Dyadobacter sp. CY261]